MNCVSHLAERDPAVEVRRAAVALVTLLLRGLKTEALQVSHDAQAPAVSWGKAINIMPSLHRSWNL